MITSILSRVMGGGRGRRGAGGAGMGTAGRPAGRAGRGGRGGSSKDAAIGRGVKSLFRRVR